MGKGQMAGWLRQVLAVHCGLMTYVLLPFHRHNPLRLRQTRVDNGRYRKVFDGVGKA